MQLHYIDGSPFARMARILIREHGLDVALHEITVFPPPEEFLALNPMGQVPVLVADGQAWFPTRIILDVVLAGAAPGGPVASAVSRPGSARADEQLLAVILAMADALVAHHYALWAGIGPVTTNRLGFDPADRAMIRTLATLDWLEARIGTGAFQPGTVSVQDIALACVILWTESREPIAWRGRPGIEAMVEALSARPSVLATRPRPHQLK